MLAADAPARVRPGTRRGLRLTRRARYAPTLVGDGLTPEQRLKETPWERAKREKLAYIKNNLEAWCQTGLAALVGAAVVYLTKSRPAWEQAVYGPLSCGAVWGAWLYGRMFVQWAVLVPREQLKEALELIDEQSDRTERLERDLAAARTPGADPERVRLEGAIRNATIHLTRNHDSAARDVRFGATLVRRAGEIQAGGITASHLYCWLGDLRYSHIYHRVEHQPFFNQLCLDGVLEATGQAGAYRWTEPALLVARRLGAERREELTTEFDLEQAIGTILNATIRLHVGGKPEVVVHCDAFLMQYADRVPTEGLLPEHAIGYLSGLDHGVGLRDRDWNQFIGALSNLGVLWSRRVAGVEEERWVWTPLAQRAIAEIRRRWGEH